MFANRFTAVLDANVLAPALCRNVLLSLAETEFYRPRWSVQIMDEAERAIIRILTVKRADEPEERAAKARNAMMAAFDDALIEDYQTLISTLDTIPDPDDRHVVAVAIKTKASVIVSDNLKHFPPDALEPLELEALSADDFISNSVDLDEMSAIKALSRMRQRLQSPPVSPSELIYALEKNGLIQTANQIAPLVGFI